MTRRLLFFTGCGLALVGLGLSLVQLPAFSVASAVATCVAVFCGLIIVIVSVARRQPALFSVGRLWLIPIFTALMIAALADFFSFGRPWHSYAQTLMMFVLAVQSLLNGATYTQTSAA